jgi:sarcosine oxidase delta subunit
MLLIDCPYCGMARPEIEFRYGGEAHIARAADPSTLSDEELADFFTSAPIRRAFSPSAGATPSVAGASSIACATH